ncbi:MAG: hypothetical protein QXJ07_03830, partial [Candidatus Bathyarchaeia archaeon]
NEPQIMLIIVVLGVVAALLIVLRAMGRGGKEKKKASEKAEVKPKEVLPFKIVKTVSPEEVARAREELRILDLEREILSDAIRKLYEAHAEGKITEEERDRLAQTYKERMMIVKEAIVKDESLVALHELEVLQEDLIKLFSERFDEISAKIEELRSKVEAKPLKEIIIPTPKPEKPSEIEEKTEAEAEEKAKKRRKTPAKPSPRTEAERRIEEIRAEVEKVLERLGQMEIET